MERSLDNYFGDPDASQETRADVAAVHAPRAFELNGSLKAEDRSVGKCIVVGIKGSGKTALRKHLECDTDAIIWNLDTENRYLRIDPAVVKGKSGQVMNVIALHLLREFAVHVAGTKKTGFLGKLKNAGNVGIETLKKLPKAVKISAPGVEVDLEALFKSTAGALVQTAWDNTCQAVKEALEGKRAYIMIDDAEEVFPELETNETYIEGVARAVASINACMGSTLHVFLFLKYGVWRYWYEHQREYDKIKSRIQHISWQGSAELTELIARRIARIHEREYDKNDVEDLWELEFKWDGEFLDFTARLASYCPNGPRDMIDLLNNAKLKAGRQQITWGDIEQALKGFSQDKLYGLNGDFGDVYPEVHRVVDAVLRKSPPIQTSKDIEEAIERKVMMSDGIGSALKDYKWFKYATKERILNILFEIGVIGFMESDGQEIYALHAPTTPESEIRKNRLVTHKAFRPYLEIAIEEEKKREPRKR